MGNLPAKLGGYDQGMLSGGQHGVPLPAPRPYLPADRLLVLVTGAAVGSQSTQAPSQLSPQCSCALEQQSLHVSVFAVVQLGQHYLPQRVVQSNVNPRKVL